METTEENEYADTERDSECEALQVDWENETIAIAIASTRTGGR